MPYPIFASSPGILIQNVDFDNSPSNIPVVLLPYASTIGDKIVVRDVSGRASAANPIIISTIGGAAFTRGTSSITISSFRITDAGGSAAVAATTPFFYTVLDSAEFPHRPAPYDIKPAYQQISTVSTYTATVLSTFYLNGQLQPLNSVALDEFAAADFTSTVAYAVSTNTLYSASNAAVLLSTGALSTLVSKADDFKANRITGGYLTVDGAMTVGGSTWVGVHYSTIAGGLLNVNSFTSGSNITVADAYSTLGNFYAAGPVSVRGSMTVGGAVSAATYVVRQEAHHKSTAYVLADFTASNYVVAGTATTSSLGLGTRTAPSYSADIGGSVFGSGMFITAASASTNTISTTVLEASTLRFWNGANAFETVHAEGGTMYYEGLVVGSVPGSGGTYGADTRLGRLYVSSFVSTGATFISSASVGPTDYGGSAQLRVDGGMRMAATSTVGAVVTHVAVGFAGTGAASTNSIKYSTDNGFTYSNIRTGGFTAANVWGFSIAHNGYLWIAGGENGGVAGIKYSTDGSNFSNAASGGFTTQANSIRWNGRMWVAVGTHTTAGQSNSTIQYSFNGSNWFPAASGGFVGGTTGATGIAWNGRMWAAIGSNNATTSIKYSFNGSNWSDATNGFFNNPRAIATNGRQWIASGSNFSGATSNFLAVSSNAINWTFIPSAATGAGFRGAAARGVTWDGNMWIATNPGTGSPQGSLITSFDGFNWRTIPNLVGYKISTYPIIFDGIKYNALGTTNSTITYSYDLQNWFGTTGSAFPSGGYNLASRYSPDPIFEVNEMEVKSAQGYPDVINSASTNTVFVRRSGFNPVITHSTTMYLNNTVGINTPAGVGINGCISSLSYSLFVYGSTFTNNPNPVKLGGGNWTTVSDSNLKEEIPISYQTLEQNVVEAVEKVKVKEFNYKKGMTSVYVNTKAIERRNERIYLGKNGNGLRQFTNIDVAPYTGSNFDMIETESQMMRQNGFVAQNVAQYLPNAVKNIQMKDTDYYGIDMDQLNMVHLAATHCLMSTIEIQTSTLRGQEEQFSHVFSNFELLRSLGSP